MGFVQGLDPLPGGDPSIGRVQIDIVDITTETGWKSYYYNPTDGGSGEQEVFNAYIVGVTPLASGWLSLSIGGPALTPEAEKIYIIKTAGAYLNTQYEWDGAAYVSIGGGGSSSAATLWDADLLTITTSGYYYTGPSTTNYPTGTNVEAMVEYRESAAMGFLTYQRVVTGVTELWLNIYNGSVWSGWDNIGGTGTDADAIHDNVAAEISALTAKTTPVDADVFLFEDSETTPTAFGKKKLSWANIKATLKTYFEAGLNFASSALSIKGTGTNKTIIATAETGDGAGHTATFPAKTMTIAGLDDTTYEVIAIACSDIATALTAGTNKAVFFMPFAMTLVSVLAGLSTQCTGSTLIVNINEGGSTILSTKLTIDASEDTSATAATAAVISDSALALNAKISIDIDQVGATIAGAGLTVYLIGTRT